MKIDGQSDRLSSWMGAICSLLILLVIAIYAYMKLNTLMLRSDMDIVQILHDTYYDYDYEFSYKNGFNIAAAFTSYDNEEERILDPSYGEL